jgi:polyvinyl alcohol dehydrogenase (cytochrome)
MARRRWIFLALMLAMAACGRTDGSKGGGPAALNPEERNAATVYKEACGTCHDGPHAVPPTRQGFALMHPEAVLGAMRGAMAQQARGLSEAKRAELAQYVTGRRLDDAPASAPVHCADWQKRFDVSRPPGGPSRLGPGDVQRLSVKWAFAFPNASRASAPPTVAGGSVFVGSQDGTVWALDEDSGCVRWSFGASAEVRAGIAVGAWPAGAATTAPLVYVGDEAGKVYGLDAATGELRWTATADSHASAVIAAAPVFHQGRLYVAVASTEWLAAADPDYECCTFRGSVIALDAATGARVWQHWAIDDAARLTGETNAAGSPTWQPAGAAIRSSPAIDAKHSRLYLATGAAYTAPAAPETDAVVALELETGKRVWHYQATPGDAWTMSCRMTDRTNCPPGQGHGADFVTRPLPVDLPGGARLLLAAQKSGDIHALDPETGKATWRQTGREGVMGWTLLPDNSALVVADAGGLRAIDPASGRLLWKATPADCPAERRPACAQGLSAAPALVTGAALAGGRDGRLRAYDLATGQEFWSFDTAVDVTAVNGAAGHGGSIDTPPVAADGKVFVGSGSVSGGGLPGNVLLMLEPVWNRPVAPVETAPHSAEPAAE